MTSGRAAGTYRALLRRALLVGRRFLVLLGLLLRRLGLGLGGSTRAHSRSFVDRPADILAADAWEGQGLLPFQIDNATALDAETGGAQAAHVSARAADRNMVVEARVVGVVRDLGVADRCEDELVALLTPVKHPRRSKGARCPLAVLVLQAEVHPLGRHVAKD